VIHIVTICVQLFFLFLQIHAYVKHVTVKCITSILVRDIHTNIYTRILIVSYIELIEEKQLTFIHTYRIYEQSMY